MEGGPGTVPFPVNFARLKFNLEALEPIRLPPYAGSTLRGGFGIALKRVVCTFHERACRDCLLLHRCVYSYLFETPPPPDAAMMRKYVAAPHPFVIEPPLEPPPVIETGQGLSFGLILVGRAIDYLPYFVYAFENLGERGLGKGRGKFVLRTIESLGPRGRTHGIYDETSRKLSTKGGDMGWESLQGSESPPKKVVLRFLTPTRLKYEGRLHLRPDLHVIIRNLMRRLSALSHFHCGGDTAGVDYRRLIEDATVVEIVRSDTKWADWERYSARQDTLLSMGGFVGTAAYAGPMESLWPFLRMGEVLHVGKGAAFGLGKYEIVGFGPGFEGHPAGEVKGEDGGN